MDKLAYQKGSPCIQCAVSPMCTKSFLTKSACTDYAKFLDKLIKSERKKYENKK